MTSKWMISRRTMLRGVGAAMALPWLEVMQSRTSAAGAANGAPVRMAALYMANGVHEQAWQCKGAGKAFELSPTLSPLKNVKDDVLVFSELMNAGSLGGDGHYVKTGGFLTGTTITKTTGKELRSGGVSLDQLIAHRIGNATPLPSLELGTERVRGGIDNNVGYTQLYGGHISWSTPTTPVGKEINPKLAFDRMFRSDASKTAADDRSVLDLVSDDARRLRGQVGKADQAKLDDYLESVRAVEKRIEYNTRQRAEEQKLSPQQLTAIEALERRINEFAVVRDDRREGRRGDHEPERRGLRGDHTEHVRLMFDLMVLAFWSDTTRVATFMFGNAVSGRNFSFLEGVSGGHHHISHHKNEAALLEQYQKINQWHVAQYAYMLEKMKAIKEGEGTLLDNSMVLFGSGMRDGNKHDPKNLPIILAGRGGGTLATGRHLRYERRTPLCGLYMGMLQRMGTPVKQFGDAVEVLPGLDDPSYSGVL